MPGLPFGAAQTFIVPTELRSYEHIVGFEFIEIDPNLPYPRSAAYRKTGEGAQMLIRKAEPDLLEVDLSSDAAHKLIEELGAAGVFDWQRMYKPPQGNFVVETTNWRLSIEFDEKLTKRSATFVSEGADEFPDTFDCVISLLLSQAQLPEV